MQEIFKKGDKMQLIRFGEKLNESEIKKYCKNNNKILINSYSTENSTSLNVINKEV